MSLSLAVNARNDLYAGNDGSLVLTRDLYAVMQAAQHAAQTVLGEKVYAQDDGIPFFDTVWSGAPNLAQYEAYLRDAILSVDGIQQIKSVAVAVAAGVLSYTATIQTIYGEAVLNG